MITIDDVSRAARLLEPVVHRTPLLHSRSLDGRAGMTLLLKAENLQRAGAFKIRGAYTKVSSLSREERARGVVAHSSGNHAQGTALAAHLLGVKATVVMPKSSPAVKIQGTKEYGARVVLCEDSSDDRERVAGEIARTEGSVPVPPFDDDLIIAGQGTAALEILEESPDIDCIVVPVGGGGLIGGTAIAVKSRLPRVRVIGVETEPANDAQRSLRSGSIVRIAPPNTIADGMRTQAVGRRNFEIMQKYVDDIVTVTDDEVIDTMRYILVRMKVLVEPTGAVATAAAVFGKLGAASRRVCAIISGGNVEPSSLSTILSL